MYRFKMIMQKNIYFYFIKILLNTFALGKCVREHLQEQVNTFAYGKCVREHL